MDTVGTFEMAKTMSRYEMFTCLHKFYGVDQWKEQITGKDTEVHIYTTQFAFANHSQSADFFCSVARTKYCRQLRHK